VEIVPELTHGHIFPILYPIRSKTPILFPLNRLFLDLEGINNEYIQKELIRVKSRPLFLYDIGEYLP